MKEQEYSQKSDSSRATANDSAYKVTNFNEFVDHSPEAKEAQRLQNMVDNSQETTQMLEWQNKVATSEAQQEIESPLKELEQKTVQGRATQLVEDYSNWFGNNYVLENSLKYIDSDEMRVDGIIISWKIDGKIQTMTYTYEENRTFPEDMPQFVKNAIVSLDQLYSAEATQIDIGNKNIDIMGAFMEGSDHNITIKEGNINSYDPETNTIFFNDDDGILFRKDLSKGYVGDNVGMNSASSQLGHEFIHGYNDEFDNKNYDDRRKEKYEKGKDKPFFPNKEEKETTLNWANQINKKLGQEKRTNYMKVNYPTE
ncbi:type III secretion system effector protein [Aureispira anguillae]|uniref:Type III secretion system effector protein n=1 Tax=Aureispira anguillae TaxID=2864201 RepID=A0A915YC37_9BACT|nr:type III secretion system effector protein [Aureispira anguillae]BDS10340.1 type III secretion system effector protein [Aureispira anguillae]